MDGALKPRDIRDVEAAVQWALGDGKSLDIVGQGSKRAIGRPAQHGATLDLSGLTGITLYEPEELVLSARAGTPLTEIEQLVAGRGQQLAFEPMDCGALLGGPVGRATIEVGDSPSLITSSLLGGNTPRSSHTDDGTKPRSRSCSVKPVSLDSGCSKRGVMKVPDPWRRRIMPCSNSTSIALRAVTREMTSSSENVRSDGSASSACHQPALSSQRFAPASSVTGSD